MARKKLTNISTTITTTTTIQDCYNEWITYCQARGLKPVTLNGYEVNFKYFIDWYGDANQPITNITKSTLQDYIKHLQNATNRNNTSINSTIRCIKTFLNYCYSENYLPNKVTVPFLKRDYKEKKIYSEDDLRKLLVKPNVNKCTFATYRNWVIINVFVSTGIRRHSLVNIKIKDIDLSNGLLRLTTNKNRKPHYVAISHKLSKILKEYLKYRQGESDDWLFITEQGTQLQEDNLTNSIYQYNRARGASVTSIHAFRHTYAVNYMKQDNADIFKLSKQLQHSNISITQNYLQGLTNEQVAKSNTFDPLDLI